ncbi:XdhC family protein [Mangrovibacterium sp.]|uniref:XdhC family protein n=1 Tax=Mangrovibacterium sp. TaxID=1961364 RepID=UPI003565EDDB
MTHEIKCLFQTLAQWQQLNKKAVLVTVVGLEGSSYRRPGVRMVINENGDSVGAVSGGCVEGEISRQAQTVFQRGTSKMITYDGRFRLGCDGNILILIEPVFLSYELINAFSKALKKRLPFSMKAYFKSSVGEYENLGTLCELNGESYSLNPNFNPKKIEDQQSFVQSFDPPFQLYIFGAEHDAVHLCKSAALLGWDVTVVASPDDSKTIEFFPGAKSIITPSFGEINQSLFDKQTAIVMMTHSLNKDVQYLLALKDVTPAYLGLLGSVKRRERILSSLLEFNPELSIDFLDQIHGPAGINVGVETAEEIAVSVLAEILSVIRRQEPIALRNKTGSIHG